MGWNSPPKVCGCCKYACDKDVNFPQKTFCTFHKILVDSGRIGRTCAHFKKQLQRRKFGNAQTAINGIRFDSKKEGRRYSELLLLQKKGDIKWFLRQPLFDLGGGVKYRADFLIVWDSGNITIEDVKGFRTKDFIRNKKLVEDKYPIVVEEI